MLTPEFVTRHLWESGDLTDRLLKDFAPERNGRVTFTTNTCSYHGITKLSFLPTYCSLDSVPDMPSGEYVPGAVLDLILNKHAHTYYASVFFNDRDHRVEYRLARLASPLSFPLAKPVLLEDDTVGAAIIDEGALERNEHDNISMPIADWLRIQIEQDAGERSIAQ